MMVNMTPTPRDFAAMSDDELCRVLAEQECEVDGDALLAGRREAAARGMAVTAPAVSIRRWKAAGSFLGGGFALLSAGIAIVVMLSRHEAAHPDEPSSGFSSLLIVPILLFIGIGT